MNLIRETFTFIANVTRSVGLFVGTGYTHTLYIIWQSVVCTNNNTSQYYILLLLKLNINSKTNPICNYWFEEISMFFVYYVTKVDDYCKI